jgi:hypothetical protein
LSLAVRSRTEEEDVAEEKEAKAKKVVTMPIDVKDKAAADNDDENKKKKFTATATNAIEEEEDGAIDKSFDSVGSDISSNSSLGGNCKETNESGPEGDGDGTAKVVPDYMSDVSSEDLSGRNTGAAFTN